MMFYSKINCKCFNIFFYFQSSSLSLFHLGSSTSELGFGLHILPTFVFIVNFLYHLKNDKFGGYTSLEIIYGPKSLWVDFDMGRFCYGPKWPGILARDVS